MRRTSAIKWMGGAAMATALAGAVSGPASAMVGPGCAAKLVAGTAGSCGFDSPTDYATITVEPVGTVTATVRCFTSYGTITSTRTVSDKTTWMTRTPGSCSLSLTAVSALASAAGTATPAPEPIYPPPPTV